MPNAIHIYPKTLRQIADLCEALDRAEENMAPADGVFLKNGIEVNDADGFVYGTLGDYDGIGWSFTAATIGGNNA